MPEKNITIQTTLAKLPTISADPNRVAQILRNLLSNAIKFSPDGNRVIISAKPTGDYIHFSVQDFGIGISEKDQLKLFEPFYQAEQTIYRERAGVGLGLAICRGIVLSQNGKIWIESKIGKGTTVHFTIPKKPVLDIKPIRVLFSGKEQTEKKNSTKYSQNSLAPSAPLSLQNSRANSPWKACTATLMTCTTATSLTKPLQNNSSTASATQLWEPKANTPSRKRQQWLSVIRRQFSVVCYQEQNSNNPTNTF